jgi:3,4-dihydroxy 2-butanone 4-phosphate synthase/GTP cyclohydrolase II
MDAIGRRGNGLIVLLMPERPEHLQAEIGRHPHPASELRDYGIGAQILVDRGVSEMVLLSDSDRTVIGLEGYGLKVVGRESIPA